LEVLLSDRFRGLRRRQVGGDQCLLLVGAWLSGRGEKRKAADISITPDAMTTGRWFQLIIGHVIIFPALIGMATLFAWHLLVFI